MRSQGWQRGIAVPNHGDHGTGAHEGIVHVQVAVGAGKDDEGGFHALTSIMGNWATAITFPIDNEAKGV